MKVIRAPKNCLLLECLLEQTELRFVGLAKVYELRIDVAER